MIDLHVHTWRCRHAQGTAAEYVRAASVAGVSVLGFAEHLPLSPGLAARIEGADGYAMPLGELEDYVQEVAAARTIGEELGVEVLCGVEVDAITEEQEHARSLLATQRFDMVLGSVHFIDGWAFDDPDRTAGYARWSIDALWERYFDDVIRAAGMGLADVIAHADLVKKFGYLPEAPLEPLYGRTAAALREAGVAVEINTAGLRKPCLELYPAAGLLRELHKHAVPVTVGSDAHTLADVGAGRAEALAAMREAGYRSVLVFRGRVPQEVGLDEL